MPVSAVDHVPTSEIKPSGSPSADRSPRSIAFEHYNEEYPHSALTYRSLRA
jgi:hypothetical protein